MRMRRECKHHKHVHKFNLWPTTYTKHRGLNQLFDSSHTTTICNSRASAGRGHRPRWLGHHKHHHDCKDMRKAKGGHKMKHFHMFFNHRLATSDQDYLLFEADVSNQMPIIPFILHNQSTGIRISPRDTPGIRNNYPQGSSKEVEGKGKGVNEDGDATMAEDLDNDSLESIDIRKLNLQDGEGTSKAP